MSIPVSHVSVIKRNTHVSFSKLPVYQIKVGTRIITAVIEYNTQTVHMEIVFAH